MKPHIVRSGLQWPFTVAALWLGCAPEPSTPARDRSYPSDEAVIPATALADLPVWRIGTTPMLTIGENDGETAYLFNVVVAATRLSNGDLLVADDVLREIRRFSGTGRHLRTYGRDGEGPGEFRGISGMAASDSGFTVLDASLVTRVTHFSFESDKVETVRLKPLPPGCRSNHGCSYAGIFPDGTVLVTGAPRRPEVPEGQVTNVGGGWRMYSLYHRGTAQVLDSILIETIRVRGGDSRGRGYADIRNVFGPQGYVALAPDAVAFAPRSDEFTVRTYSADGQLLGAFRVDLAPKPVSSDVIEEVQRWARARELSPVLRETLEGLRPGGTQPLMGPIYLDRSGRLWVKNFSPLQGLLQATPVGWTVFSVMGQPLAVVPEGVVGRVLEIGKDEMIVVRLDEFDVQRVVVLPIEMN